MTGKINIRRAKPQDYPALAAVFFEAVREGIQRFVMAKQIS